MRCYGLQHLQSYSKRVCILYRQERSETIYTYREVLLAVDELLADYKRHHIAQDVGIALQIREHTPSTCVLLLSILNHNCHFCPFDTNASTEALRASGAKYLICAKQSEDAQHVQPLAHFSVFNDNYYIGQLNAAPPRNAGNWDDMCYTICTSGSTGTPKVVHVPYNCIAPNIAALSTRLQVTSSDVIFLGSPPTFDPFVIEFFLALQNGSTLLITTATIRLAPHKLLRILFPKTPANNCLSATILQMTPSLFRLFGVDVIKSEILHLDSTLRILLLGGEEFPTVAELKSWCPSVQKRIFNIYGITELSCWSTIYECNISHLTVGTVNERQNIALGTPIDHHTQLRIVSAEGAILHGVGEGELHVGSETRKCYIAGVDTVFHSNNAVLFRGTGDWVQRGADGETYYKGRRDNVIKRYGKRLCLEQLEQSINNILATLNTKAVCVWESEAQKLYLFLTALGDKNKIKTLNYRRILQQHLLDHERPDSIVEVASVPLTRHGKLDRRQLQLSLSKLRAEVPTHPVAFLRQFLCGVLAIDLDVDVPHDTREPSGDPVAKCCKRDPLSTLSFTAAGGSSFQALSLATEIDTFLAHATDQSVLLELLLDPQMSLSSIVSFLETCELAVSEVKTPFSASMGNVARKKMKFQWRADLGKCVDAAPASVNQRYVCVGSHSHRLLTLDATNGVEISSLKLPDRIECKVESNIELPHLALVGCYDGTLYAFNYGSGVICWRVHVGGMIKAKPLVCKSNVIVGSYAEDYNIISVCLKTQNINWRKKIGIKGIYASPIQIDAISILICTLDGSYARLDVQTGRSAWIRKCNAPIFATPVLIFNTTQFVLAEVAGKVHIGHCANGEILHTFAVDGNIFSSLTATSNSDDESTLVLFGCYDKSVYCLQCSKAISSAHGTLTLLWRTPLDASIFSAPLLLMLREDHYVFVCTTKGNLALLALDTGQLLALHELKAEVFSTPCCALGNRVYFGCRDNFLYCFSVE